jgi:cytochrome b subunit of formate dehydrogenase
MHRFRFPLVVRPGSSMLIALWASLSVTAPAAAQDAGALPGAATPVQRQPSAKAREKSAACTAGCHQDLSAVEHPAHKELACAQCHANVTDGQVKHEGALDELPPEKTCTGCHSEETRRQTSGLHKALLCENCHGSVHGAFKRYDSSTCKGCHGDQVKAFNASIHGTSEKQRVRCMDCHGDLHDVKKSSDPLAPSSKVLQVSTCSECHNDLYVRAFRDSVHGQGVLRSGLAVAPSCSTCHGSHDIVSVKNDASRISRANVTSTCGGCHTFIVSRWKGSTHGQLWAKNDRKGPVCTTCHPGHYTFDPRVYGNHLKMADKCGECHPSQAVSYRDSFHGKATRLGLEVAATCADCHTPHEMLPASDPKSSVHPANVGDTCAKCHGAVSASFVQFEPHLDAKSPEGNRPVHYVWLAMTALLVGVFGFFTIHTFLWLQRSIVAYVRKEIHPPPREGTRWIRRFRPVHIAIHMVMLSTFLLLAATGLPIKFSGEPWALRLGALLGGVDLARLIHRIAGVATFGYALWFLGYLIREVVLRKRRQLLFGWQSMTPRLKDLADLWQNLRWFLYLGERPRLDRWAYWEKFDFFAVFWGIPMIGLSGLMLWFPRAVTSFLPGTALNVAYIIHSDEALLATGFIFFFHFFHTHLRPEAFPMDLVMFLGRMPLERFKEERPAEYQHLVESGELEKYFEDPPSERAIRRSRWVGFTTLTLGVILGIFLIIAGLRGIMT